MLTCASGDYHDQNVKVFLLLMVPCRQLNWAVLLAITYQSGAGRLRQKEPLGSLFKCGTHEGIGSRPYSKYNQQVIGGSNGSLSDLAGMCGLTVVMYRWLKLLASCYRVLSSAIFIFIPQLSGLALVSQTQLGLCPPPNIGLLEVLKRGARVWLIIVTRPSS